MADEQAGGLEPTPEAPQADAGQDQQFDAAYVKSLRAEAAKYRKEAQAAQAKVAEFQAQQMTETERLQAAAKAAQEQAQAAQVELRKARADAALAREAGKHGLDPGLLAKLVELEFDDSGTPTNVTGAVEAVFKTYPQLKPQAITQPGATNPGRLPPKLTMADIKRMTPDQINARWEEVSAVLEAGGK